MLGNQETEKELSKMDLQGEFKNRIQIHLAEIESREQ
jgi:hypothetical protein